jgi:hypothetical protein
MKFKTVAVCAVVALGASAGSAMAGTLNNPATIKSDRDRNPGYDRVVGSCDDRVPGIVTILLNEARLRVPEQMSWAQIRSYPHDLKLSDLERLSFRSNASDPGVVYLKITTEGQGSLLFSPNTQSGGEQGVRTWATHDVLDGTVRFNDDSGTKPDVSWSEVLARHGDDQVKDMRITAGCANPVEGALVQVDDLTINDEVIDFN